MKSVVYETETGGELVISYSRYGVENVVKLPFDKGELDKVQFRPMTREFLYDLSGLLSDIGFTSSLTNV